jgi:predicted MPP superfamily phosphohydrolase
MSGPRPSFKTFFLSLLGKISNPINPLLARYYRRPRVVRLGFESARVNPALAGFRIVFLSDLHAGATTPLHYLEGVFEQVNQLHPDLIALGGDYIFRDPSFIDPLSLLLGKLRARHGVYAVYGNHDHWINVLYMKEAFAGAGVRDLSNAGLRVGDGARSFWLCGVEDLWEGQPRLEPALVGRRQDEFTLLLSHNPDFAESVDANAVDLMLSGHTHGGQVRIFGFAPITNSRYGADYLYGIRQRGGCRTYISQGVGAVELMLRIGCPPEITLVELKQPGGGERGATPRQQRTDHQQHPEN